MDESKMSVEEKVVTASSRVKGVFWPPEGNVWEGKVTARGRCGRERRHGPSFCNMCVFY
jgi:hypothetical protein